MWCSEQPPQVRDSRFCLSGQSCKAAPRAGVRGLGSSPCLHRARLPRPQLPPGPRWLPNTPPHAYIPASLGGRGQGIHPCSQSLLEIARDTCQSEVTHTAVPGTWGGWDGAHPPSRCVSAGRQSSVSVEEERRGTGEAGSLCRGALWTGSRLHRFFSFVQQIFMNCGLCAWAPRKQRGQTQSRSLSRLPTQGDTLVRHKHTCINCDESCKGTGRRVLCEAVAADPIRPGGWECSEEELCPRKCDVRAESRGTGW